MLPCSTSPTAAGAFKQGPLGTSALRVLIGSGQGRREAKEGVRRRWRSVWWLQRWVRRWQTRNAPARKALRTKYTRTTGAHYTKHPALLRRKAGCLGIGIWRLEFGGLVAACAFSLSSSLVLLLDGDLGDGAGVFAEVQEQVVGRGGLWELDAEFYVLGR